MSTPTQRAGVPSGRASLSHPSTVVVGLLIAFCALLLLKWLAVVALVALALAGLVWWARRDPTRPQPAPPTVEPAPVPPRVPADDDCSWCGLSGGHRALDGRHVRPRHVHQVR